MAAKLATTTRRYAIRSGDLLGPKLALLAAAALCVVPFLNPIHLEPITTFVEEALVFGFGLLALIGLAVWRSGFRMIPSMAIALGALAGWVQLSSLNADAAYPQFAQTFALYAIGAAAFVLIGRELRSRIGLEPTVRYLAFALAAAAFCSALFALVQFYAPTLLPSIIVFPMIGGRATANLAQANQFANLVAMGLCSVAYLHAEGALRRPWVVLSAVILLWGSALSGSRIGLICLLAVVVVGVFMRRARPGQQTASVFTSSWLFCAGAVGLQLTLPVVHGLLGLDVHAFTALNRFSTDDGQTSTLAQRMYLWSESLRMFQSAPVFGIGVGNFASDLYMNGAGVGETGAYPYERNAHNLVLQLLAETGLIGAAIVLLGLTHWAMGWVRAAATQSIAWWWLGVIVAIQLVHSMVEHPLWHAHFLAITAITIGVGSQGGVNVSMPRTIRLTVAAASLVGCATLVNFVVTYETVRRWLHPDWTVRGVDPERLRESYDAVAGHASSPFGHYVDLGRTAFMQLSMANVADNRETNARAMQFAPIPIPARQQPLLDALDGDSAAAIRHAKRFAVMYPQHLGDLTQAFEELIEKDPERFAVYRDIAQELKRGAVGAPAGHTNSGNSSNHANAPSVVPDLRADTGRRGQ